MYLDVGEFELEVLGQPDYPFYEQVVREITNDYEFEDVPFEEGDAVIDVGAHVGLVSIYLARKYGVRCYAYEPAPENFASLVMNVGANQAQVIPRQLAVSADGRPLEYRYGRHSGEGGAFIDKDSRSVLVASTTVGEIMETNRIERCRLLKLDCEGAEHEIMADSDDWLERVDHIRGELHLNKRLRGMGHTLEKTRAKAPDARWQEA